MTTPDRAKRHFDDPQDVPMLGERVVGSHWQTFKLAGFTGDTVTVRFILGFASIMQVPGFVLPLGTLKRPFYAEMTFLPGWAWACLYMAHALGVWWRFRDLENNEEAGYIVNGYGFALWLWTTWLANVAVGTYSPSTGMEWTVLMVAFGALLRTGDRHDRLSA